MSFAFTMAEPALSPPRKRPHPDDLDKLDIATTPIKGPMDSSIASDSHSTPLSSVLSEPSPPSPSLLPSSQQPKFEAASAIPHQGAGAPPPKRRKLTTEEKERMRLEKEAKDKARQEAKAQKEEERKLKEEAKKEKREKAEEERRVKEEALRAKREQVEEKKRAKELEQAKKEEEKAKKERAQLRLNAFFSTASGAKLGASPSKLKLASVSPEKERREKSMSIEPRELSRESPCPCPAQPAVPEYKKCFFPFELPSHAVMAPSSRETLSANEIEARRSKLDELTVTSTAIEAGDQILNELKERVKKQEVHGMKTPTVRSIIAHLVGSSDNPIDLTNNNSLSTGQQPLEVLQAVPMKYLHFHEDVRPPYHGTFTRVQTQSEARRFARNPFRRGLPQTDYDYDSEAEWEEPEEGEDLDSEIDEENESVDDGDDMEGFLDDEEDAQIKRQQISSDLEPVNSGIWWEDAQGVSRKAEDAREVARDLSEFRMGFLLEPCPKTIDPFSTSYWVTEPVKPAPTSAPSKDAQATLTGLRGIGLMNPPRAPLSVRPNSVINSTKTQSADQAKNGKAGSLLGAAPKPPESQKRMVPQELMLEFKAEISGSDLTKVAMVEALKKKFPKIPKDAIQNTLRVVAERTGKGPAKTWTLR